MIKKFIFFVLFLFVISLSSNAKALTKEEINEIRQIIREELQHVNQRIGDMDKSINQRIDDMDKNINKRIDHIYMLLVAIIALNGAMVGSVVWLARQDKPIGKIHYDQIIKREVEMEEEIRLIKKTIENLKLQKA